MDLLWLERQNVCGGKQDEPPMMMTTVATTAIAMMAPLLRPTPPVSVPSEPGLTSPAVLGL